MKIFFPLLLIFVLASCSAKQRDLNDILKSGELRILTLNTPTTYFEDSDAQTAGLEYEMTRKLAKDLGVEAKYIIVDSIGDLFDGLDQGRGDLIAAGISITDSRKEKYNFGPSFQEIEKQVICKPYVRPKKIKDLIGFDIAVMSGTSYVEVLESHKKKHPDLEWIAVTGTTDFQLFEEVANETYDCTISDSNIASVARRPYPSLEIPMTLKGKDQLAWPMRKEQADLQDKIKEWFRHDFSESQLNELKEKYYGHTRQFDPFDTKVFHERVEKRLPELIPYFKNAAKKHNWPWRLLAAIAYQESQWDPNAKSPTGVRGIMMLTRPTAKQMEVKDRTDPEQSIMGGAKYLTHLRNRVPSHIPPADRMWMTFAAYNIGFQHLRNARAVAVWRDLNPNSWANVRKALPLLTQKRYYKYLPNGFARGSEPVVYVDRIRHYYDLILKENL